MQVQISGDRALKERQCTPKGQAQYENVWGSVHCKVVYRVGSRHWGCKILLIGY